MNKYYCYLNGKLHGCGDLKYMSELFNDYVLTMKMYGRTEMDFKIVEAYEDLISDRMGRKSI